MTDAPTSPKQSQFDLSNSDAELLTMKEFCRLVRMSQSTINRLRRAGKSPPIVRPNPKGRGIRVVKSRIPAWISSFPSEAP